MPSVISGDANVSATEFGFLDGVTSGLQSQIDSKLNLAGGKILQIVRATDGTDRSTTSTSYVDVTGMSVTITPTKSDSAVLLVATGMFEASWDNGLNSVGFGQIRLTDSSNNLISGGGEITQGLNPTSGSGNFYFYSGFVMMAYATPATTSAVTYKLRFQSNLANTTVTIRNGSCTGQMFALEISA